MKRYIAFLRGINVGGHRVKMDVLRGHFSELGLEGVTTFLASGNVAFSTEREDPIGIADDIEARLGSCLDFEVPVVLRTVDEVAVIADFHHGIRAQEGVVLSHYVVLFKGPVSASIASALAELESDFDAFVSVPREVHWVLQGKLSDSPLFGRGIERAFGGAAQTMRNVSTIRRLAKREGS